MDKTQRAERLKKMLIQIAPRNAIEAVSRPSAEGAGYESLGGRMSPPPNLDFKS
jgi:hypothetical protein